MSYKRYELDVRLLGIEPPIWRTVEVPGVMSLEDVHYALQVAMGWTNSHLHQFTIGDARYGMAGVDGAEELELEDEGDYPLEDVVAERGTFLYEYDFGDGWEHQITVTKVTTVAKLPPARCTAGARACPPEDCGGPGGYANLLAVLADPKHEEHASFVTWANGFKPERFKLPKTGRDLRAEMAELHALADDDGDDSFATAGIDDPDRPPVDLPKALVASVLALDPMQRASLVALIAGSLATDVVEVHRLTRQLLAVSDQPDKKRRRGRS